MPKDPVCGMEVDEESANWISEHGGEKFYFCAAGCKNAFDADPGKYLSGDNADHKSHHGHHM